MQRRTSWLVECLESRLAPALATWDGGGADSNWTTAANWVGDIAPQPGDDLVFPAGAGRLVNVNDFAAGTGFNSLGFAGLDYRVSGNRIMLGNAGVAVDAARGPGSPDNPVLSMDLTLIAPQTWTIEANSGLTVVGAIDLAGQSLTANVGPGTSGAGLLLAGPITGAGSLVKVGPGFQNLTGNNTYSGLTDVRDGYLSAGDSFALGASGPNDGTRVGPAAYLQLQALDSAEPITFAGSAGSEAHMLLAGQATLRGPITLAGPAQVSGGTGGFVVISRGITEVGGPQNLTLESVTDRHFFATGSVSTYTGVTTVRHGTTVFNGAGPAGAVVAEGGWISGTGSIGPATAGPDGTILPGDGAHGTLTTGGLSVLAPTAGAAGGRLLSFLFDGNESNQVDVRGAVQLGGSLETTVVFPIAPPIGTRFRVITNDGADAVQGTFANLLENAVVQQVYGLNLRITYRGGDGNDVELIVAPPTPAFSVGAGSGGGPQVNVYSADGSLMRSFLAYDPAFRGGVHVVTADITGDGVSDIVTAPASGGGPDIRVFDGITFALEREFNAYDPSFFGGVFIASADIDADGRKDIVTGAGPSGGPHVKVFSGVDGAVLSSFLAYDPQFHGGVSVAATDGANVPIAHVHYNGTIITGAGPGGGPHVRTFDGITGVGYGSFFAYAPTFTGGVNVAVGEFGPIDTGGPNIVTAPASAGGPDVRVYNSQGQVLSSFLAYGPSFVGGVTVAVQPIGRDGTSAILTGAGPGGGPHVEQWEFPGPVPTRSFLAFDPAFLGGAFVG